MIAVEAVDATLPMTLPVYVAWRSANRGTVVDRAPSPEESAALFDESRRLAVAQLGLDYGYPWEQNTLAVPPLVLSSSSVLRAAASGETLAQLTSVYSPPASEYVAASETRLVSRQVWTQQGERFLPSFLAGTERLADTPAVRDWQGGETNFVSSEYLRDPAFTQSIAAAHLLDGIPLVNDKTHLMVVDSLTSAMTWPDAVPFTGVFRNDAQARYWMPMLSLTKNVVRYSGSDFTADAVTIGDRTLMTIRPTAPLRSISAGQLDAALVASANALIGVADPALLPAGHLVLPVVNLRLATNVENVRPSLTLPFDEIHANLRALDGVGGTYARAFAQSSWLQIDALGLTQRSANWLTFTFSQKNLYGSSFGIMNTTDWGSLHGWGTSELAPQCGRDDDLQSFYLIVLDARKMILSLATIGELSGTVCR